MSDPEHPPVGRRTYQVIEAVTAFSPAEDRFNRRRTLAGLITGPILFVGILLWPSSLPSPAHRLAAISALMIVFWMTEALPLAVTAIVGPTLAVVLGVASARVAFAPFADPIIFLFMGSFMLAEAMFVHHLDRRLAFTALASRWVGSSAFRLGVAYALVGALLSMWMSNTATTAMLFPLGLAVLAEVGRDRRHDRTFQQYTMAVMLLTSFAASIGGMATPVGTPPNLIGMGLLRDLAGISISFTAWSLVVVPAVVVLLALLLLVLLYPRARKLQLGAGAVRNVRAELERLGPVSPGERNVILAFAVTVALWVLPGALQALFGRTNPVAARVGALMPEAVAAVVGAVLLFILPVNWAARRFTLTWEQASRIDWGVILLFGGGLAMGQLAESTGLSKALGAWIAAEFPHAGGPGLTVVFTAAAVLMSEAASNTASANIVVPMAIAVAQAAGVSPLEPAVGATLGASLGFMMPISTPPNAIVYSSGYMPIGAMVRHGLVLDLIGFVVILAAVFGLGGLLR